MTTAERNLIINADGFGFTRGINRGIEETAAGGMVTSISVNANFDAVDALPDFVRRYPHISVGVHLNPVVGRPLSAAAEVPTLVTPAGEFHGKDFTRRLLSGAIDPGELAGELSLQIARVRDMGISITHLDSHQNQHLYPPYFTLFLTLLADHGIARMRTHIHYRLNGHAGLLARMGQTLRHPDRVVWSVVAACEMQQARRRGIRMADRLVSVAQHGDKAVLDTWLALFRRLPAGWNELYCHPAYPDDELRRWATYVEPRRQEVAILTDPALRAAVQESGICLRSFSEL